VVIRWTSPDQLDAMPDKDFRNTVPRFTPETRKANKVLVDLLAEIANARTPPPPRLPSPGRLTLKG
jgi:hypothetical protein